MKNMNRNYIQSDVYSLITYLSRFFFFFFLPSLSFSLTAARPSASTSRSFDGVRTRAYRVFFSRSASFWACNSSCSALLFFMSSFALRSGSKLEPSTKYSDIPNASRSFAFFSCCASAI